MIQPVLSLNKGLAPSSKRTPGYSTESSPRLYNFLPLIPFLTINDTYSQTVSNVSEFLNIA